MAKEIKELAKGAAESIGDDIDVSDPPAYSSDYAANVAPLDTSTDPDSVDTDRIPDVQQRLGEMGFATKHHGEYLLVQKNGHHPDMPEIVAEETAESGSV